MKYLSEKSLKSLISNMKVVSSNRIVNTTNDALTYFNTFEDLKNYDNFQNETVVATLGYKSIGDGGATKFLVKRVNLCKLSEASPQHYVNNKGELVGYGGSDATGFISVEPNTDYTYSGITSNTGAFLSAFYDKDKNLISLWHQEVGVNTITTPENCYYIRMTATPIKNFYIVKGKVIGDKTIDSDIEITNSEFCLRMIVENDSINMVQLGYFPNIYTQDCHDAIMRYVELCKRDNKQYELYIPDGVWCFSETDIYVGLHKGIKIRGVAPQTGYVDYGNTVIMPFNDNQEYIWNLGETSESTVQSLNGCNVLKDLQFTTGNTVEQPEEYVKSFCKIGLMLTFTCYSEFDGLYFRYFSGTGLAIQNGWENHFGYLNFRQCGYFDKEQTYCPLWVKKHPTSNPGSGFSANYFYYINFERINGSAIYFEPGVSIVHSEFNNIQVEWSKNDYYGWNKDFTVTYGEDEITWDDTSENIEHIYIVKGQSGHYNSICFNTISVSGCGVAVWTATYTDEEGNTVTKYKRQSGIFGPDELYKAPGNSLNVIVSTLTGIGGGDDFPAFHGVDMNTILRTNINIGVMHGLQLLAQAKNLVRGAVTQNNKSSHKPSYITGTRYYVEDFDITSGGYVNYDPTSSNNDKMCFSHGDYVLHMDGSKKLFIRMKFTYPSLEDFPDRVIGIVTVEYKDGTSKTAYNIWINKTDIENGIYPLNEWFDYEVGADIFPFDDVIIKHGVRMNSNCVIDYIDISSKDRTVKASNLTSEGMLKSTIGAQAWCTDRKETAEDDLGVMMVFNGTEWKSIKGTKLSDLVS